MSKYKTAMGKSIDMALLRSKNQNTRAVGNMNVDAAGNTLDSNNQVISDSSRRVNQIYNRTMTNPGAQLRGRTLPNSKKDSTRGNNSEDLDAEMISQFTPPATTARQPQPDVTPTTAQPAPPPAPPAPSRPLPPGLSRPQQVITPPPPTSPVLADVDGPSQAELAEMEGWETEESPPIPPTITDLEADVVPPKKSRRT